MSREKVPAVYILASKPYGTLYTGVTSDLCSRVQQHKQGLIPGFTKKYDVKLLGLVRVPKHDGPCNQTREEHQGVAARVEDNIDRGNQPTLARPVCRNLRPI